MEIMVLHQYHSFAIKKSMDFNPNKKNNNIYIAPKVISPLNM